MQSLNAGAAVGCQPGYKAEVRSAPTADIVPAVAVKGISATVEETTADGRPGDATLPSEEVGNQERETEQRTFQASSLQIVAAMTEFGSVEVSESGSAEVAGLEIIRTISSRKYTPEQRRAFLQKVQVVSEVRNDRLEIRTVRDEELPSDVSVVVNLRLKVPRRLALEIASKNGAVSVQNAGSAVKAVSEFGAVTVNGATGTVEAISKNGAVTVENGTKTGSTTATSEFGEIILRNVGGRIEARTKNGAVTITDATQATTIKAGSEFGAVKLTNVSGSLTVISKNGAVLVRKARVLEALQMLSDFGEVQATEIQSMSPALKVEMGSSNGAVRFDGDASILKLGAKFGAVQATVSDKLNFTEGQILTENGSVTLTLPRLLAAKIQAFTEYGDLQVTGFPQGDVTMRGKGNALTVTHSSDAETIATEKGRVYRAQWNNGTAPLTVGTKFGNVTLKAQ